MKDKYRELCLIEPSIPIFSRDWWLDAVAGRDNWDVAIVEKGGQIRASMPYVARERYGLKEVTMPPLTQTLGPWLRQSDAKYVNRLSQQKDLMNALIDQLPNFGHFAQNWHYGVTNWAPFYWRGFQQTTRYTYVLRSLGDEEHLWGGFQENIRGDIRKATNRFQLRIHDECSIKDFIELNRFVFSRQGMEVPYSEALVHSIDQACVAHNARKIFVAEDDRGERHAGVYLIWDNKSAYYLMGGGNPDLRNSGATSLCMWEAIKFAATVTERFDFEGSMIEPVERFFRAFGAVQTPYFAIRKTPSILFQGYRCLRDWKRMR